MQVTDGLVGLLGRRGLGGGGRSHGFRCDRHLADRTVVQSSGYTPQLSQLHVRETVTAGKMNKVHVTSSVVLKTLYKTTVNH